MGFENMREGVLKPPRSGVRIVTFTNAILKDDAVVVKASYLPEFMNTYRQNK
jgi:hypothetical protein